MIDVQRLASAMAEEQGGRCDCEPSYRSVNRLEEIGHGDEVAA